jgi:hypothetical protein
MHEAPQIDVYLRTKEENWMNIRGFCCQSDLPQYVTPFRKSMCSGVIDLDVLVAVQRITRSEDNPQSCPVELS